MSSSKHGVAKRISELESRAVCTHSMVTPSTWLQVAH